MDTKTIAWLAGLLEGEASFSNGSKALGAARIDINMTDRDVIDRVAKIFKAKVYTIHKPGQKTAYQTQCCTAPAIGLMMTTYTFLGERRRAKIRAIIRRWRTYQRKTPPYKPNRPTVCVHGHPFDEANTYRYIGPNGREWRQCKTCKAALDRKYQKTRPRRRRRQRTYPLLESA